MMRKTMILSAMVFSLGLVAMQARADCGGDHGSDPKDIVDTAVAAGDFETLVAAVKAADLVSTLKSEGPFTVFAPTDAAFAKLPKATLDDLLKPENKAKLAAILTYHVIPGRITASQALKLSKARTANGQQVDLVASEGKLTIDKANVVKTDIACSNGVIHVIDSVILPSDKTILETARKAGMFKTLAAAIEAAELSSALNSEGPFTVFAPTDEAFGKLPEGTLESLLKPENRERLVAILKYHVVPSRAFAVDALAAGEIKTLQGDAVRVRVVDGQPRVNDAAIVKTDIDASNGVIHVIDRVLLPREEKRADAVSPKSLIEMAIERGAPLYNDGHPAACAAIYEVAAMGLLNNPCASIGSHTRMSLQKALNSVNRSHSARQSAWIMRHALDEAYQSITAH